MILSICIGKSLITSALIDEESLVNTKFHHISLEYQPDRMEPIISIEKVRQILKDLGNEQPIAEIKINLVKLSKDLEIPDFEDLKVTQTDISEIQGFNFIPIVFNKDFLKENSAYFEKNIGVYLNFEHYHLKFPSEALRDLEIVVLNKNIQRVADNADIFVSNAYNYLEGDSLKKYLPTLFRYMVPLNPKARIIKIKFDHKFEMVSVAAALGPAKMKEYLRQTQPAFDLVILNLNSLKKYTLTRNDKDVTEKLESDKINYYPLNREDEIRFDSSVIKEDFKSITGLVLDTRNHARK